MVSTDYHVYSVCKMGLSGVVVMCLLAGASCGDDSSSSDNVSRQDSASEEGGDSEPSEVVPFSDEVRYESHDEDVPQIPEDSPIDDLEVSLDGTPQQIALDQALEFRVVFENVTDVDVNLEPCPVYYMAFGESSYSVTPGGWFELNCSEAGTIPAGESLAFEMQIGNLEDEGIGLDGGTIWWAVRNGTNHSASSPQIEVIEP